MTICARHGYYPNIGTAPRDCPSCILEDTPCPSCAAKDARIRELEEVVIRYGKRLEEHITERHALRAIVTRVEDVEGMAKHIGLEGPLYHSWGEECSADTIAEALSAWLKEGK